MKQARFQGHFSTTSNILQQSQLENLQSFYATSPDFGQLPSLHFNERNFWYLISKDILTPFTPKTKPLQNIFSALKKAKPWKLEHFFGSLKENQLKKTEQSHSAIINFSKSLLRSDTLNIREFCRRMENKQSKNQTKSNLKLM